MTQKQYHARLKKFTRLYRKMRTLTKEMKEAGFAYPIGVSITSFGNSEIHLSADQGEVLPEFDFSQIEEYQSEEWIELSTNVGDVKYFYLIKPKEDEHVGNQA